MIRHSLLCLILLSTVALLQCPAWCSTSETRPHVLPALSGISDSERLLDTFVSHSPLEKRLFADAADGRLDGHTLLAAALVAGGVDKSETVAFYEEQLARHVARLRRSGAVSGSPRQQVRAIFTFMHRELLRGGYRVDASDLATVFDEGHYNCVSASVLFCCLCGRFGITVKGLEIPGHAMTRVLLPDETLDIEATCPAWFSLVDDPQRREQLIRKTLGRAVSSEKGKFRCVSGVQLVATIYYNRGVDLLGRRRFAEAMEANCKAVRLDHENRTAWGNLLATLNNWAIDAGGKGRFADAVSLLEMGLEVDPNFQAFASNYTHVHHQWVESLCRQGYHKEALKHLEDAARRRPQEPWFRRASQDVYYHWTQATSTNSESVKTLSTQ